MSIPFIDLKTQYQKLKTDIQNRINLVLDHGQYIMGPEVFELEDRLSEYTGAKHCITVSSGTDALVISLMALGIGCGDEVITTPFTFAASAEAIALVGARPVFVDIETETCNINYRLIEEKISDRTKAILPVSLYGQPADMEEINTIAKRHGNIPVIEDAAQSFGATYRGRKSCNLSTLGCTSFFPSKPLGCYGDGGAIFTNDDTLARACREIRIHGQSKRYVHTRIGVGGRMDTIQCAIILAKLETFQEEITQRQLVAQRYSDLVMRSEIAPMVTLLKNNQPDRTSVFAQYTVMVQDRDAVQDRLHQIGIPTAIHYPVPLNEQPAYSGYCCTDCTPIAQKTAKMVISLPMHPYLTELEQKMVVAALKSQ